MRIGFIGLGVVDRPMMQNLIAAGHELSVYRSRTDVGAHACASAKELAERSEVVILMVPDTPDVEVALFSPDGMAEGLRPGSLVIDMSSISPTAAYGFAEWIEDLGYDYLDAVVPGGELGARDATLTIMVGGRPDVFERARPIFETLGRNVTLIGTASSGQTAIQQSDDRRIGHGRGRRSSVVRAGGRRPSSRPERRAGWIRCTARMSSAGHRGDP
jgi:2-hydroxy-3-oxopropionate reductase